MFIKPIFSFAVCKFVCTLGATTNINELKYRIQGQFSKSQGKFSSQIICFTYTGSVSKSFFYNVISEGWEGFTEPSKPSPEYRWSDNQ